MGPQLTRPAGREGTVAQPHTSVPDSHAVGASCLPSLYKFCPGPDGPVGGGLERHRARLASTVPSQPRAEQPRALGGRGRGLGWEGRGGAQAGGGETCARCPHPGSGIPAGGVRLACPQRRRLEYSWLTQGSLRLGLAEPLGDGTARWAQEPPAAGTAVGARVKFILSGAWSQEEEAVAARSVPGRAPAPEGHTDLHSPGLPRRRPGVPTHPSRPLPWRHRP